MSLYLILYTFPYLMLSLILYIFPYLILYTFIYLILYTFLYPSLSFSPFLTHHQSRCVCRVFAHSQIYLYVAHSAPALCPPMSGQDGRVRSLVHVNCNRPACRYNRKYFST